MPAATPPDICAEIVRLMPSSNGHDLAAKFNLAHSTVIRIARRYGAAIHGRSQPALGVRTIWNAHRLTWPLQPRNQRALDWAS